MPASIDADATRDDALRPTEPPAIAHRPPQAAALSAAARLAKDGKPDDALRIYAELRQMHPASSAGWLRASALLRELKRADEAERLAAEARARFPAQAAVWTEWARAAEARGAWAAALERWHQVLTRSPGDAAPYVAGSAALRQLGRAEAAEAMLLEAQHRFPADATAFIERAWLAHREADWPEAVARWREVRARFPAEPAGYTSAVAALREIGQDDAAIAALAAAVGQFPESRQFATELAQLAEARGDWSSAALAWAAISAHAPRSPHGPLNEARALRNAENFDGADRVIEQARTRMPDSAALAEQYARNAIARGDPTLATARLEAAAERFPAHAPIHAQLRKLRSRAADAGDAAAPTGPGTRLSRRAG